MFANTEYFSEHKILHASIPYIMGTALEFVSVGAQEELSRGVWDNFCGTLSRLNSMLNRFDPRSELSRVNSGECEPSRELRSLIDRCGEYRERTEGLFDIRQEGWYDFGGFAKGYALSLLRDALAQAGITTALTDFGRSSILATGHHPCGDCWKVSLTDPFSGKPLKELELRSEALSASGNSPGYEGHIKNPLTGLRCEERKMATVISPDPLDAEVLSTVMMIADDAQAEAIRKNFPDTRIEIYFL